MVNTVPSDYVTGTITLTNGSAAFTGTGTGWLAMMFRQGDLILDLPDAPEFIAIIDEVTSNTAGTLTRPWLGPTFTGAYRMRYQWDAGRVTAMSAFLREELGNGNLQAFAALVGSAGGVPVFIGPGAMEVRPASDFVNGVAYDVQVDTLADRAAFDGQSEGFAVLVSDVGDGRSALFSKASNAVGDWTDPAYITGPIGASPNFAAGTTTTVPPGTPADVDVVPDGSGGYLFDFDIPAGEGFIARGPYSGATAYNRGDVVQNNGSSWVAKTATTGNAPPALPTISNTWWELLAAKGTDGTGTGDITGTLSALDGLPVVSSGTSTKSIRSGAFSTQAEAEAGTNSTTFMTPLTVSQAIAAQGNVTSTSILAMQAASAAAAAIFGPNWIADSFGALAFVDVAGATDLDTATAGVLKATSSFANVAAATLGTTSGGWQNSTLITQIGSAQLLSTGAGVVQVTFNSAAAEGLNISAAYIGHAAASGDAYDFETTPTQLLFSGSGTVLIPSGGASVGQATFTVQSGKNLLIAFSIATDAANDATQASTVSTVTGWTYYYKSGVQEASTVNKTGYTTGLAGASIGVSLVRRSGVGVNNLTVASTPLAALASPSSARATIKVKEVDTSVAGTDYTLEVSRDNGATWTAIALTDLFVSPSPVPAVQVVQGAKTTITGPAGTNVRWRLKTLNNKNVEFHDIYLEWN